MLVPLVSITELAIFYLPLSGSQIPSGQVNTEFEYRKEKRWSEVFISPAAVLSERGTSIFKLRLGVAVLLWQCPLSPGPVSTQVTM